MKNKYAQLITDVFSKNKKASKRKRNILETDDSKEYVNEFFNELLNNSSNKRYSHYTDKGAVYAEKFSRTLRNLIKRPVFEKQKAGYQEKK